MRRRVASSLFGILALIAALGAMGFSSRPARSAASAEHFSGSARLVSYDSMSSAPTGWECDYEPVSYQLPLREELQQERIVEGDLPSANTVEPSSTVALKTKPLREIHDSFFNFSAVAVDPTRNEVVLTDENLFNIVVYDRTANTGPKEKTPVKRDIGGLNAQVEFQCGLYVDPSNGDIYAVNNDTLDRLVIFSHDQQGDVSPARTIRTPHGTFGIAVDSRTQDLFLSEQHDSAVVVFKKDAKDDDPPIRLIQGDHTGLADPHGIALDEKNNLLYVTNHGSVHQVSPDAGPKGGGGRGGEESQKPNWPLSRAYAVPGTGKMLGASITVYREDASGDAVPERTIKGPDTQLNWPTGLAIDTDHNELFVANDGGNDLLVFKASDSGDVAPARVLKGERSLISNPTGVYLDSKNNELWVANFGNHTATVYPPDASGDTPPLRVIRSAPAGIPVPGLGNPHPIAYDPKRQQILVPNCVAHPQIAAFDREAQGSAEPVRKLEGEKTLLGRTMHGIAYDPVKDEFTVPQQLGQAILTFRGDANGEEPPVRVIQGPHTQLKDPELMAEDPVHREIFIPSGNSIFVYPLDGNGDVAPIRILHGKFNGAHVAVNPVHDLLIVGAETGRERSQFMIYNRTDSGDAEPKSVIGGPHTRLTSFGGPFTVYPPKGEIIASLRGTGPYAEMSSDEAFVGVWSIYDKGDVPPKYTIGGPKGELRMPRGITLDPLHKTMLVSDKRLNAVLTYYFPEIF